MHHLATFLLASLASAQATRHELVLHNPTERGSPRIEATAWLPNREAPAQARRDQPRPSPVVVFLHGNFQQGRNYAAIGRGLAELGFACVLPDTHATDPLRFGEDAFAMFATLRHENARPASPLYGRLDMGRAGLCGHSWGGAHTVGVLADNPGYRVGVALAPHHPLPAYEPEKIRVPFAIVANRHDARTPPELHVDPTYARLIECRAFRARYVLRRKGGGFNHLNVAMRGTLAADRAIFDRSFAILAAMMHRFLCNDANDLEALLGKQARAEGELSCTFETPQLFATGRARVGETANVHLAGERGIAILYAALERSRLATAWGTLGLDPRSAMVAHVGVIDRVPVSTLRVPLPRLDALRGLVLHYQGLARNAAGRMRLSPVATLRVSDR